MERRGLIVWHCPALLGLLTGLAGITLAADREADAIAIQEPVIRAVGKSSRSMFDDVTVLGAIVDRDVVAISLKSIEGLRDVAVVFADGRRALPKAIVMLPDNGFAAISVDCGRSAVRPRQPQSGDSLQIVRQDGPKENTLVVTSGVVSSKVRHGFSIDTAVGGQPRSGVVINQERELVGIVVISEKGSLRALDVQGIRDCLRERDGAKSSE